MGRESGMHQEGEPLAIDVVSDVVCPWCYLGEKRLEAALKEEPGPVAVRWRPYQLDPTIPEGGLDRAEYMAKKFGKSGSCNRFTTT
jgi:predicted DsbA family dithiol-disulfide isomerase